MSDGEAMEADALERLEAALDRIALRTQSGVPQLDPPQGDSSVIAARLDRLIGQLRDALADATAGEA